MAEAKFNETIGSVACEIDPKYEGWVNNISRYSDIIVPRVVNTFEIMVGASELKERVGNSSFDIETWPSIPFTEDLLKITQTPILLVKHGRTKQFYLVLLFLMKNRKRLDYMLFEKIVFTVWEKRIPLFCLSNTNSDEITKGNYLVIDLDIFYRELSSVYDEVSFKPLATLTAIVVNGTLLLGAGLLIKKFLF